METTDTILAASSSNFWFTLFVIIVWGLSSYFDWKRKQAIKQQRRAQLKEEAENPSQEVEEIDTPFEQDLAAYYGTDEAEKLNSLKHAEEAVKNQEYRTVKLGDDLQAKIDAVLKPQEVEIIPGPETKTDYVPFAKPRHIPSQKIDVSKEEHMEPHRHYSDAPEINKKMPKKMKRYFPGGVRAGIIAAEILNPPKALRRRK
jgi:hypothetical protein